MKKQFISILMFGLPILGFSQVGVGTNYVHPSAKFQIESNDKGFLQPRIALDSTKDVTTIASPATGLMVYNTATAGSGTTAITPGVHYFDGVQWVRMQNTVINAGTGTTITGTGSTASPYVINSTGGSSAATVRVTGSFLSPNTSNRTMTYLTNSRGFSVLTSKAMKLGAITLPVGKWEVKMNNFANINTYNYINSLSTVGLDYWLQNDSVTYDMVGLEVLSATSFTDRFPPLGGGDTLTRGSVSSMQPLQPATAYHQCVFYINNTSGADKTYYLFASEYVTTGYSSTGTLKMPQYGQEFASDIFPSNRFYAVKIE